MNKKYFKLLLLFTLSILLTLYIFNQNDDIEKSDANISIEGEVFATNDNNRFK